MARPLRNAVQRSRTVFLAVTLLILFVAPVHAQARLGSQSPLDPGSGIQPHLVPEISTTIVISEFRTRGPNGGADEFIEIFNLSQSTISIGGWVIDGSNSSGTTSTRATIPSGTTLSPGCRYLFANSSTSGGPYSGSTPGDQTYTSGITNDGGIAICTASGCGTIIDQVGMSAGSFYKEGTPLAPMSADVDQSRERLPTGVNGTDTDDNANDFLLNSGSSNPQNSGSSCTPLAVTLADFSATAADDHILVTWETASELNNAGFNLYRSATGAAPEELLAFVPSQVPGSQQGASYQWQDRNVAPGDTWWYWLEDIDFSGATTLHGPVSATVVAPTAVGLVGMEAEDAPVAATYLRWLAALVIAAFGAVSFWRRLAAESQTTG